MTQTNIGLIIAIVLIPLVIIVGLIFRSHAALPAASPATTASTTLGAATTSSPSTAIVQGANSTVVTVGTPSYSAPLVFAATVNADIKPGFQSQFNDIVAALKNTPNRTDLWFRLGTIRKMAGDYPRAIEDWTYVATTNNALSADAYRNLADLYMNFIKDYYKAEASYLAAIQIDPANVQQYEDLSTLYSGTSYHPTATAAEDILKKGITANPKAVELQVALARYYVSVKRTADARAEFDAARANATAQGETALAAQIQQEESSL